MKRRNFLKGLVAAPAAVVIPDAIGSLISVKPPAVSLDPAGDPALIDQIIALDEQLDERLYSYGISIVGRPDVIKAQGMKNRAMRKLVDG